MLSVLQDANEGISEITGQTAWGLVHGVGSMFDMCFGEKTPRRGNERYVRGQWNILVQNASWRIERGDIMIAGGEDSKDKIHESIQQFDGETVKKIEITPPFHDLFVTFSGQLKLCVFSTIRVEYENWTIFLPEDRCFVCGPGGILELETQIQ